MLKLLVNLPLKFTYNLSPTFITCIFWDVNSFITISLVMWTARSPSKGWKLWTPRAAIN